MTMEMTRLDLFRRAAAVGLSGSAAASLLAACGSDNGPSTAASSSGVQLDELGKVGGSIQLLTYAGYEGADAIKPWLKDAGVNAKTTFINNQDDVTTRLRTPAGKTTDAAQLGVAQIDIYRKLNYLYPLQEDWLSNAAAVEPYFVDLVRQKDGALTAMPFAWGGLGCNYRPDKTDPIESWKDLTASRFKGRIAMIDDPVSTVQTGALALGIREPNKMTKDQLGDVKEFLGEVRQNARTVAAGYGDVADLLVAGDVWTSFQGWNAIQIFAAQKGGKVLTAYPSEGTVGFVDCWSIPRGADNKRSAVAFVNQMISKPMQVYVGNDLASGAVRTDVVDQLEGVGAQVFDYDNLQELFETKLVFALDAPIESDGDVATHEDWVAAWEDVKAG